MAEFKRIDPDASIGLAERDTRAEALLVEGLDRYFSGQYDDAIHLWTRVLFLDRSHARARAYIERARTALAERQRRADEMLHATDALVERGDVAEARRQLTQVVAMAGEDERVAVLRTRLDRIERATVTAGPIEGISAARVDVLLIGRWRRRLASGAALVLAGAIGGLIVMLVTSPAAHDWLGTRSGAPLPAPPADQIPLQILSPAEVAIVRARTLYAHGRLAEALAVLDRIADGGSRPEADELRVEIQDLLLRPRPAMRTTTVPRTPGGRP
jgi:Tetratricopeptide repeat